MIIIFYHIIIWTIFTFVNWKKLDDYQPMISWKDYKRFIFLKWNQIEWQKEKKNKYL